MLAWYTRETAKLQHNDRKVAGVPTGGCHCAGFTWDWREHIIYILQYSSKGHSPVIYIDMLTALIYVFRLPNLLDVKEIFTQTVTKSPPFSQMETKVPGTFFF